jgi:hypothetical protein
MPQTITQAVGKLKKLRDVLADPTPFFERQLSNSNVPVRELTAVLQAESGRWIGIARDTAREIIARTPPPDVSAEEWALFADYVASKVLITLAPGGNGVVIFLGESQAEFQFAQMMGQATVRPNELTVDQIKEYVEAGLRGDPLGKEDITAHDVERTAQQTAWNVLIAFYKRNFSGTREQEVVRFLEQRSIQTAEEYFPAILAAWREIFSVVAPRDMAMWVEEQAKKILA